MDGVHDLGGMHGFGRVEREENEPSFHHAWEAAVLAMMRSGGSRGIYTIDEFRHSIERMVPSRYLAATYYEKWLDGITRLYTEKGVITREELEKRLDFFGRHPDAPASAAMAAPPPSTRTAADPTWLHDAIRPEGVRPRFAPGDRVVARQFHPGGHTRLPRYARGKRGVIDRIHGIHVFPDTNAHGLGEQPQPLYSVRFDARELWGESAEPQQAVYLDCWERYLLPGR